MRILKLCLIVFATVATLSLLTLPVQARLLFVGPDPYFSYRTFPQDANLFKNKTIIFFNLDKKGWMGNLDFPDLSPSPTYVDTQESVSENVGSTTATAGFKGTWFSPSFVAFPVIFKVSSFTIIPMISGQWDSFKLQSSGTAVAEEEDERFLIPFSSELKQVNKTYSLGSLITGYIGDTSVGLIINYSRLSEGSPSGYLKYNTEGQEVVLGKYNWGWSTIHSCNHIFGVSANIDAFWQDDYTETSYSKFDLVLGADLGENKIGFRFRRQRGTEAYYRYESSVNDYVKSKWGNNTGKTTIRSYNVLKITDLSAKAKLFVVTFAEASFTRNHFTLSGEELLDGYRENDYEAEMLPFIHFQLPRNSYLRIGTSISITKGNFKYKEVWGSREVYSSGWANYGWEEMWERPSYGNFWRFTIFSEADLELMLSQAPDLKLILNLWTHHNFVRTKKYYGWTESEGDKLQFHQSAKRDSKLNEFWLSGTVGFMFGNRIKIGIFADLPIQYDNFIATEISGEKGYFKGETNAQPKVRQPARIWTILSFGW